VKPTKAQLARSDRKDRIVTAAREIAEVDGWSAVTVRRLAEAIGFSQPVLYGHFPDGRDGIVRAVALAGFARLATVLQDGDPATPTRTRTLARERVRRLAEHYLDFARQHPAVYEAMFSLPTDLAFATAAAPPELRAGFGALAAAAGGDETRAEVLWSALHGLADLGRHGRLRAGHGEERIGLLVDLFAPD
jgi:AcrR family transcriptional regulator